MPGRAPAQVGQPRQPFGPQLKAALVQAAPLFSAMAAGYSSGRGPYAYLDQGIAGMQDLQKQKRDEEAAAAAAAAFGGLVPGGMGPAGMSSKGGTSSGGGFAPVPIDPSSPDAIAADTMTALGRGNDWLKYSNQGATRNDPLDAKLVDAMSFLPQMGITMDVISGGQEAAGEGGARKGSVRHDHGMAADVDFYKDGRKLDWNNPADLPLLTQIVQTAKSQGVTGIGAGDDYMGAGRFHVGFGNPAVWGKGGQSANAPAWLVDAYNGAPSGSVTMSAKGEGSVSGVVDPLADPYVQRLMQVMAMPGLTDEQRSVVELQLQTRMGQLTAPNPDADEDRARERRARDAELLGYGRGTPEWNQYVVTGEIPAGFDQDNFTDGAPSGTMWIDPNNRAAGVKPIPGYREPLADPIADLKARAAAAGIQEGTPEYQQFMLNNGKTETGMVIESDGQGGFRMVQGAGAAAAGAKPFTEGQSKDIVFATRAEGALASLDPIANALTSRGEVAADWLPMGLGGGMQTDEYQVAKTAGDEFLQAILRKDTGAAITTQEQALYGETYLPRPGDSPARLQYKQEARKRAVEALKGGMSPAQIIAQEKALEKAGAAAPPDTSATDADGWKTLPGGVKVRVKP